MREEETRHEVQLRPRILQRQVGNAHPARIPKPPSIPEVGSAQVLQAYSCDSKYIQLDIFHLYARVEIQRARFIINQPHVLVRHCCPEPLAYIIFTYISDITLI